MTAETLTLGTLSRFYKGIHDNALKTSIAQPFGIPAKILVSWLHALTHLRNVCAHHGRLWNRVFSITPLVSRKHRGIINNPKRLNAPAVVLVDMLDLCAPNHTWRSRFRSLLDRYPEIDPGAMGFDPNWRTETLWQGN